jgi:hypothetical protein
LADKTVVRVQKDKNNPYVMLNKGFLNDDRMSWRAKGLLAYLLSKPDDWQIMIVDLVKKSKEGRDAVYNALKELEELFYLTRNQERDIKGKMGKMVYTVYEQPLTENPYTENPDTESPYTANPTLLINDNTNNECTNQSDLIEFDSIDSMLKHYMNKYNLPEERVMSVYDRIIPQYKAGNIKKFTPYFEAALEQEKIDYERNKFIY